MKADFLSAPQPSKKAEFFNTINPKQTIAGRQVAYEFSGYKQRGRRVDLTEAVQFIHFGWLCFSKIAKKRDFELGYKQHNRGGYGFFRNIACARAI